MRIDWANRLGKWRSVFAGWQLGTRSAEDPECQAVKDHRELSMLLRAEVNALTYLLISKGLFTEAEYTAQLQDECRFLCEHFELRFPGFKAVDDGMQIDTTKAQETTRGWRP